MCLYDLPIFPRVCAAFVFVIFGAGWSSKGSRGPKGKASLISKKHLDAGSSFDSGSVALIVSSSLSHLDTEKMDPKGTAFAHSSVIEHLAPRAIQSQQANLIAWAQHTRPPTTNTTSLVHLVTRDGLNCITSSI